MNKINDSIMELCLGKKLGSGCGRIVYVWRPDPSLVIKISSPDQLMSISHNIAEWELWKRVIDGEFYEKAKSWLAPCTDITNDGKYLLQKRTEPIPNSLMPKEFPIWMTDICLANIGMIDDKIVFHDYATNLIPEHGLSNDMKPLKLER